MAYEKALPVIDADGKPFWESCREHAIKLQRCASCGAFRFPPSLLCRQCGSDRSEWTSISGRGTVYTAVTVYQAPVQSWQLDAPYSAAIIELAEGPRLWSNVVDCPPDDVRIGMSVELVYDDVTEEVTLPKFRPSAG